MYQNFSKNACAERLFLLIKPFCFVALSLPPQFPTFRIIVFNVIFVTMARGQLHKKASVFGNYLNKKVGDLPFLLRRWKRQTECCIH